MKTYVKVGETLYPDAVDGTLENRSWGGRESKSITLDMPYADAAALFADGTSWSIVQEYNAPKLDVDGNPTGETETVTNEYDNSDFDILGDITVHRDGTCTIHMGKATETEILIKQLYGGYAI